MNSATISSVEKARRYASEPDRIKFESFSLTFRGGHDTHTVSMQGDSFTCTCHHFEAHIGMCSHIMAVQRMLATMLTDDQQTADAPFAFAQT